MRLSVAKPLVSKASQSSARARIEGPSGPEILVFPYYLVMSFHQIIKRSKHLNIRIIFLKLPVIKCCKDEPSLTLNNID